MRLELQTRPTACRLAVGLGPSRLRFRATRGNAGTGRGSGHRTRQISTGQLPPDTRSAPTLLQTRPRRSSLRNVALRLCPWRDQGSGISYLLRVNTTWESKLEREERGAAEAQVGVQCNRGTCRRTDQRVQCNRGLEAFSATSGVRTRARSPSTTIPTATCPVDISPCLSALYRARWRSHPSGVQPQAAKGSCSCPEGRQVQTINPLDRPKVREERGGSGWAVLLIIRTNPIAAGPRTDARCDEPKI